MRRYILGSAHSENKFVQKKNRIYRFFKKHRYLRGIFNEKHLDERF